MDFAKRVPVSDFLGLRPRGTLPGKGLTSVVHQDVKVGCPSSRYGRLREHSTFVSVCGVRADDVSSFPMSMS